VLRGDALTVPVFARGLLVSPTAWVVTPWTGWTAGRSAAGWWSARRCRCSRSQRLLSPAGKGLVRRGACLASPPGRPRLQRGVS